MDYEVTMAGLQLGMICVTGLIAIANLLTLCEVRKQRQNTYLPEIGFLETRFDLWHGKMGLFTMASQKTYDPKTENHQPVYLKICNIGFGAAQMVKVAWTYDLAECVSAIKKVDTKDNLAIRQEGDKLFVLYKANEGIGYRVSIEPHDYRHFLLPYKDPADAVSFPLPMDYALLVQAWAHAFLAGQKKLYYERPFEECSAYLPPLKATLTYVDIAKKTHIRTLLVSPEFNDYYDRDDEDDNQPLKWWGDLRVLPAQ